MNIFVKFILQLLLCVLPHVSEPPKSDARGKNDIVSVLSETGGQKGSGAGAPSRFVPEPTGLLRRPIAYRVRPASDQSKTISQKTVSGLLRESVFTQHIVSEC